MPPEDQAAESAVESQAPAPVAVAEPAAGAAESLGTLTEAFRDPEAREALKAGGPRVGPDDETEGSASPGESAPEGASKPGERLSRRGAASAIADRDAEIERLASERVAEKQRADDAAARATALEQGQEAARRAVLDKIGDDKDFAELREKRVRNRSMSYEEDERLDSMLKAREDAHIYWELAERGHKVAMAKALGARAEHYGLDRETVFGSDLPTIVDHAVAATEVRVRREEAEKRADLERELKGLRPRAAAARTRAPTVGGASGPGGASGSMPDDGASPMEFFRAGIQSGAHRRSGTAAPSR
jgi:hypothetical protein